MHRSVFGLALACQPTFYDSNASNPPEGNDPNLFFLYASETSTLYAACNGEDRIIVAYNDLAGVYSPSFQPLPRPSYAGISIESS